MGSGRRARSVSLVYDLLAHLGSNVFMSFCIIIRICLNEGGNHEIKDSQICRSISVHYLKTISNWKISSALGIKYTKECLPSCLEIGGNT